MVDKNLPTGSALRVWAAIFAVIVLVILAGGYGYYREETEEIHQEKYQAISAIGKLKSGQIQQWRKDRLSDITVVAKRPFLTKAIGEFSRDAATPGLQSELRESLNAVAMAYDYSDALLLDPDGNILVAVKDTPDPVDTATRRAIASAIASRDAVFSDFFRTPDGIVYIDVAAVVRDAEGQPLAVAILRSNAEAYLYPLIQSWPTPSRSAETLLVQREGEEIVFLNELRHKTKTALSLREPLTRTNLPAVQAVLGKQGKFEGNDYRDVEVLADLLPIPGSPWFMVAKVDADEIFAEARYRVIVIVVFVGSFILLAAAATAYVYRRRQTRFFQDLYESERQQRETQETFRITLYSIGDAVITTDTGGRVRAMNPVAETLTGWLEAEARGKPLQETLHIVNEETHATVENPVQRVLREGTVVGLANHTLLIARDGTERPIADSAAPIRDENGSIAGVVLIFRDITERKRAEEALQHQFDFLQQLINAIPAPIFFKDVKGAYAGCNKAFEEFKGLRREEIIGKSVFDISPPDLAGINQQKDKELYDHGGPQMYEGQSTAADGTLRDIVFHKATLSGVDGSITGMVGVLLDITERKRSETAVQESRDRYRALFENMLNGFAYCKMLFDDQGRPVDFIYLDVNQAFTRLTGLKNVVGRKVSDVIPGIRETSPELFEIYGRVATTGKPEAFEIYLKPLEIWFSISAYSLHPGDFMAVFDNITERKRDEEALRVSHRFLEIVHDKREMAPLLEAFMSEIKIYTGCEAVGIRVLDEEGRIPYRAYTGFSQEFFDLESPLSITSDHCMCINVIKGTVDPGLPFYTQGGSFYMNGTTRFLATVSEEDKGQTRNRCNYEGYESVALVPFRDGERILGLIHVADRREGMVPLGVVELLEKAALQLGTAIKRVRAEQELRESEERYRVLVEVSSESMLLRNSEEKIVYANPSALALLHASKAEDLLGHDYLNFVHLDDREESERRVNRCCIENSPAPWREHRLITRDDKVVYVESTGFPIKYKGQQHVLGIYHDLTERKRSEEEHKKVEEQFRQAQKMEAVGRLAGGVAHDFNNMLGVILGFTDLAITKLPADDPIQMYLDEVKSAAQRSADITRQLLAFARKQTIAPKVLDLNDTIASMLKMLRRLIGEDIDLLWKPAKDLWPVKMDPAQIDQVLANLMVNARDAIAGVGKITIETGKVEFDKHYCKAHVGFVPGRYVLLAVSDDGCGMDKKTLAQLFEPFFTTKEVGKGTGLGVATIYGIVKQNNGFINVYSEPGQGTTFKIYLPRQEPQEAATEQPRKAAEVPIGTETVLLVEDEKSLLKFARMLLEELGYTVLAAGSPREAIQLAKEYTKEIHLLITDVVMPQMSGRDLWQQLKTQKQGLKCLFMSGYTANVIAHHGVLDEGVHFLQKPFSREALATKIREAIASTHSSMREANSQS